MPITPERALEIAKKKKGNEDEIINFWIDELGREIDICLITYAENPEIHFCLSVLTQCLKLSIYQQIIDGLISTYNCYKWHVETCRLQGSLWLRFTKCS
jgi:hypothetical protein